MSDLRGTNAEQISEGAAEAVDEAEWQQKGKPHKGWPPNKPDKPPGKPDNNKPDKE